MQSVKIKFAYRKGFRRLWFVIAAIWVAATMAFWVSEPGGALIIFQLGILPMAILYLFGVICVWVIEGFARADR